MMLEQKISLMKGVFRDEKSGRINLEASYIRDAQKLERLILVVVMTSMAVVTETHYGRGYVIFRKVCCELRIT